MNATEYHLPNTDHEESMWVKLNSKDNLLIVCIYNSPSGDENNQNNLSGLIQESTSKQKYSHILLMGDLNYRNIDWNTWTTPNRSEESNEFKFIETIRDSYLYQHINQPTNQGKRIKYSKYTGPDYDK